MTGNLKYLVVILVSVVLSYAAVDYFHVSGSSSTPQLEESVFDRVMRTGVIRCGYFVIPPMVSKDLNRGELQGFIPDVMKKIGESLSLKIEYVEETSIADFTVALQNNRIDAYCSPSAPVGGRVRAADFTRSMFFVPFYTFQRVNDDRFKGDLTAINNSAITVSTHEGAMNGMLKQRYFPDAKILEVPALAASSDIYLNVATRKADVVIQDLLTFHNFNAANQNILRIIPQTSPVYVTGIHIAVKQGEYEFVQMLNWAIKDLENMGDLDRIAKKYGLYEMGLLPASKPYADKPEY